MNSIVAKRQKHILVHGIDLFRNEVQESCDYVQAPDEVVRSALSHVDLFLAQVALCQQKFRQIRLIHILTDTCMLTRFQI